jgi:hypothetical protein
VHIDVKLIPAERVKALGGAIRIFEFMKIARLLVVIQDNCLIELA